MGNHPSSGDELVPSIHPSLPIFELSKRRLGQAINQGFLSCPPVLHRAMPRLCALAGPSPDNLVPITDIVNTGKAFSVSSDLFEGKIAIFVKNFIDPSGRQLTSEYFERDDRKGITWSIQVRGRFLQPHSADDILFGNIFEKRLKLPWGSGAALKFMQFIDPTLEHNLTSTSKPWALSPLIATMPHFAHERLDKLDNGRLYKKRDPELAYFPPPISISDDTSQLWAASTSRPPASLSNESLLTSWSSSSDNSRASTMSSLRNNVSNVLKKSLSKAHLRHRGLSNEMAFRTPGERRSYFSGVQHRQEVVFGPQDLITMDFCYGYLEFSPTLSLRLPGGISFDLVRYWDKHPVRFICCERRKPSTHDEAPEDLVGDAFWCISFEEGEDEDEELSEPASEKAVEGNLRTVD